MFRCISDGLRCYSGADLGYLIESCGSTPAQAGLVVNRYGYMLYEGGRRGNLKAPAHFFFFLPIPIIYRLLAIYLLYSRRLLFLAEFRDV